MNNETFFIIDDLEKFVQHLRVTLFDSFGKVSHSDILVKIDDLSIEDRQELDQILSQKESENISKTFITVQTNKTTGSKRNIITEKNFHNLIDSLNDRMVSNILNSLVNKGLIETAYDESCDDFVFWVKNDNKNKEEKPETD